MLDVAIIGGGPAGLSAALYLARGEKKVKVFERAQIGGDLNQIPEIANYPGYHGAGEDLAKTMRSQAEAAGAEFAYGECTGIDDCEILAKEDNDLEVPDCGFRLTVDGEFTYARTVLVASGAEPRELKFQPEPPVSYCALCDAEFARGKKIAVIGGADSAVQEAIYLANMVKELTVISHSALKAKPELQKKLQKYENVRVLENIEPTKELLDKFEYIFVFIGKDPATKFLQGLQSRQIVKKDAKFFGLEVIKEVELFDEKGYILTGKKGRTEHRTAINGLYAAGDIRHGVVRQVVTAAGDGAAAGIEILDYLNSAEN